MDEWQGDVLGRIDSGFSFVYPCSPPTDHVYTPQESTHHTLHFFEHPRASHGFSLSDQKLRGPMVRQEVLRVQRVSVEENELTVAVDNVTRVAYEGVVVRPPDATNGQELAVCHGKEPLPLDRVAAVPGDGERAERRTAHKHVVHVAQDAVGTPIWVAVAVRVQLRVQRRMVVVRAVVPTAGIVCVLVILAHISCQICDVVLSREKVQGRTRVVGRAAYRCPVQRSRPNSARWAHR